MLFQNNRKNSPTHISIAQLLDLSSILRTDVIKSFGKNKIKNEIIIGVAETYGILKIQKL